MSDPIRPRPEASEAIRAFVHESSGMMKILARRAEVGSLGAEAVLEHLQRGEQALAELDALRQQLAEAEAQRERLKGALEKIIQADNTPYEHLAKIARAALLAAHPEQPK